MIFYHQFKLELSVALRYLQSKNKEAFISITSLLSLVGIMLGVAALIVVMSVMNGYKAELTSKLKGFNSDIIVRDFGDKIQSYDFLISKIKENKSVRAVIPVINEQSLLMNGDNATGVFIKSLNANSFFNYPFLRGKKFKNDNSIILGYRLASSLGVSVGDEVKLVSTQFDTTVIGIVPRIKSFYVSGVFKSELSEYDSSYAIIPLITAQKIFSLSSEINNIEVFLFDSDIDLQTTTKELDNLLEHKYQVIDWQRLNQALFNALKTERAVMFIILTFIIIVAAFNIISSLTMLVHNKSREIAILKTIGFSTASIVRIFLCSGMILGIFGTCLGVALGLAFAYNIEEIKNFLSTVTGTNLFDPVIYYLEILPSKVDYYDVVNVVAISIIVSFCATLYPSYKAGKVSPVEGLKND